MCKGKEDFTFPENNIWVFHRVRDLGNSLFRVVSIVNFWSILVNSFCQMRERDLVVYREFGMREIGLNRERRLEFRGFYLFREGEDEEQRRRSLAFVVEGLRKILVGLLAEHSTDPHGFDSMWAMSLLLGVRDFQSLRWAASRMTQHLR